MIVENRRNRAHIDWPLIILVEGMAIFGILAVCVASFPAGGDPNASLLNHIVNSNYAVRQVIFVFAIAPIVLIVLTNFPYDLLKWMTFGLFLFSLALLTVTWVFNRAAGVKAWLDVLWGFTIQPSEFIKLTTILMLARYLANDERPLTNLSSWINIGMVLGIPALVTVGSGEMGSLLVIIFMAAVMLYFANTPMKIIITIGIIGAAGLAILYAVLVATGSDSYRLARILAFLNPEMYSATDAYQMRQSQMAIGSGGMHGIGTFVEGAISQLNYVPADWTDFIFATIGEAWGFVGCVAILVVYLLIIMRMLYLARFTRDRYGMLVIYGVIGMLLFHIFENIGMTMGLMPITGIPLPFLSYGGSNMVTNMGGIGLVLNITKNRSLTHTIRTPQRNIETYTAGRGKIKK